MNPRKFTCFIVALMIAFGATLTVETGAAKKKTPATTAQSSKKGGSKDKSKSDKNSKNSKADKGGKGSKDSKNSKNSKNDKADKNGKNSKNDSKSKKGSQSSSWASSRSHKASSASPSYNSGRKSSYYRQGASAPKSSDTANETVSNDSLTMAVNEALTKNLKLEMNPGNLRVNRVVPNVPSHYVNVQLNENYTYLPVNQELINDFESRVKKVLPDSLDSFKVYLKVGDKPYSYYINSLDKLPEKYRKNTPFVVAENPMVHATEGMEGDIVALWHSHGRYYKSGGWAWQRPFLFETAEDLYTMSYVLPFLTPMLENAGAYVMLPRERDFNTAEVIVDNDLPEEGVEIYSQTGYKEQTGSEKWETGEYEGFTFDVPRFRDTENPFTGGTYRQVKSTKNAGKASTAAYYPELPEDGEYAVYVSYKSLPNSAEDARYTVNYSGGSKDFIVNQKMGGGTWIYLGTFPLRKGQSSQPTVVLSNVSNKGGNTVVTADAIKIGGGMGNIERSPRRKDVYWDYETADYKPEAALLEEGAVVAEGEEGLDDGQQNPDSEAQAQPASQQQANASKGNAPKFSTSGLPRFLEGARYWLHWAGFPESVYSTHSGNDDYKDDYMSRGRWVNYLAGGSRVLPGKPGLGIPVDVSFALHTDAGLRQDESIVGTLGIYYTSGGGTYADGTPKKNSRILTDMIMRQVVGDLRRTYEPSWTRRSMWDKSYAEASGPEVPATLLELLSHQNFADMRYGLDPTFRFTVSRSIYKAIGRFVAERKGRKFVVQPLPVQAFAINYDKKGVYKLSWQPTKDDLEPSAMPDRYIIMERTEGDLGFHRFAETKSTSHEVKISDNKIHSFYVVAANDGGVSFPSEILALREGVGNPVLIVNGFTRVSAPDSYIDGRKAGFSSRDDFGAPYKYDISFTGYQREFNRGAGEGFGKSGSEYVSTVVGGNTFDYPALHGAAVAATGRGFVSCSVMAVETGAVKLENYKTVDLILGKQKTIDVGGSNGLRKNVFPTFSAALQEKLAPYVQKGGQLIVSGNNIVTDLYSARAPKGSAEFAASTLGIENTTAQGRYGNGSVKVDVLEGIAGMNMAYSNTLRRDRYIVEKADVIEPVEGAAYDPVLYFGDSGKGAGMIVDRGKGTVAILSIPFEAFLDSDMASRLMKEILNEIKE